MEDTKTLNQTIKKQTKEIDLLKKQTDEMKNNYDSTIKNLMGSIDTLKRQNSEYEKMSKDNVRVKIIQDLKKERKDQEQVISLLRKYISNEGEVDEYLLKEFNKNGEQRLYSYEELKIRNKELENKLKKMKLKLENGTKSSKTINNTFVIQDKSQTHNNYNINNTNINDEQIDMLVTQKFRNELTENRVKIERLEKENAKLKSAKERMESIQNDFLEKFKKHNEEMEGIKSAYDDAVRNIENNSVEKFNSYTRKIERLTKENEKLKLRIQELIQIGETSRKDLSDTMIKLQKDNDIYVKLLDTKKREVDVYKEELDKFKGELDKYDGKDDRKYKRLETEKEKAIMNKNQLQFTVEELNQQVQQKDMEISNLKNNNEVLRKTLGEEIKTKDYEITLLNEKIEELESIIIENKNKNKK